MRILHKKKKQRQMYRDVNSNDYILRFDNEIQFNINEFPLLKHSGQWSSYTGNCYRGFSSLNEEELYTLFANS